MKKRVFLAALSLVFVLALFGSTPAQAQVRVGVAIGGPRYVHRVYPRAYVAARVYVAPRPFIAPRYVVPGPYVYSPYYGYAAPNYWGPYAAPYPAYVVPRRYYGPRAYVVIRP